MAGGSFAGTFVWWVRQYGGGQNKRGQGEGDRAPVDAARLQNAFSISCQKAPNETLTCSDAVKTAEQADSHSLQLQLTGSGGTPATTAVAPGTAAFVQCEASVVYP
jgi:hypothetical protein